MTLHTYLMADRIAASHHNELIRSAAQRNVAANRNPDSGRRRRALSIVATLRTIRSLISPG